MKNLLPAVVLMCFLFGTGCDSTNVEPVADLSAPVLLAPGNGSDTADAVLLDWEDVPDARHYEVQVSRTSTFTDIVHETRALDRSEEIVRRLTRDVPLFWRTRAVGADFNSGVWSATHSFKPVRQAFFPGYPNTVLPANGSKNHETAVLLQWEPVDNALSYHLVVTIDEDMLLYEVDLEGLKGTSYFLEDLVLTYPYWWKIRSMNEAGYSDWSPTWIFEVKFDEN